MSIETSSQVITSGLRKELDRIQSGTIAVSPGVANRLRARGVPIRKETRPFLPKPKR